MSEPENGNGHDSGITVTITWDPNAPDKIAVFSSVDLLKSEVVVYGMMEMTRVRIQQMVQQKALEAQVQAATRQRIEADRIERGLIIPR